jgi:hypothetical protein
MRTNNFTVKSLAGGYSCVTLTLTPFTVKTNAAINKHLLAKQL